jgi:hypothetical protein
MSAPHYRLFEASLAALCLADRAQDEVLSAPREQWHKSIKENTIRLGNPTQAERVE